MTTSVTPAMVAALSQDDILLLSEGNPGAITAMLEMISEYQNIDPQAIFGSYHVIMFLKDYNFKGTNIWNLWKNVCDQKHVNFAAVMRGHQMGFITRQTIDNLAKGDTLQIDFPKLIEQIKERLPTFNNG